MRKSPFKILTSLFLAVWVIVPLMGLSAHGQEPLRVAIFPFQFQAKESLAYLQDTIFVTIAGRLTEEGGIEVVDQGATRQAVSSAGTLLMDLETVRKITTDLGADYAISGDFTKEGELVSLNARLTGVERGRIPLTVSSQYQGLDAAVEGLGEFADRARRRIVVGSQTPTEEEEPPEQSTVASVYDTIKKGITGERPAPPKPAPGLQTLQTLPTFLRGIGVGDVDGDGSNETVVIDAKTLWIYKPTGSRLRLFRKIGGHRNDDFLTLDVADVNNNGFSEIVVSNIRGGVLRSFILEFEGRRIKKISDREPWFFRVVDQPGEGLILVGQKMGLGRQPSGPIYPLVWKGKRFVPAEKPLMKKEVPVFSFNIGAVDGGDEPRVAYLDYHDFLHVVNHEGGFLWESPSKYGGSDVFYPIMTGGSMDDKTRKRVYIPGRLLMSDLDGDGVPEVVVSRNRFKIGILERTKIYDRATVVNLTWGGIGLVENWKTPDIPGYISDYQIEDVDNDGTDEIVMTAVSRNVLRDKASSSVLVYRLF